MLEALAASSPPVPFDRGLCQACAYPTYEGPYEMCSVCYWEDDPVAAEQPAERVGGPNGPTSLVEAREHFERYGSMFAPDDPYPADYARAQATQAERRRLATCYDRLIDARSDAERHAAAERCRRTERGEDE